jgi:hypothetical protein
MPSIMNQTLSIDRIRTSARLRIDFDIAWDVFERRAGQEYLLQAEIWGEDGPAVFDGDNRLFTIGRSFATDGTAMQHISVDTRVPARDLNEDTFTSDEIFALLRITPTRSFGPATARTNTVRGDFG